MDQLLRSFTALPNLHAAVVHFPIALLPLALLADLASFLRQSRFGLERLATGLYALGALSAGIAFWAGHEAAAGLSDLPPAVHGHIAGHSDWALYTVWVFFGVAVVRIGVAWRERREPVRLLRPVKVLILITSIVGQWLLIGTADRGGALVYRYGVAVATVGAAASRDDPEASVQAGNDPAGKRLVRSHDGSLSWIPRAEDAAALGTVLTPGPGFSSDAVLWVQPKAGAAGLALDVKDRVLLLLPGLFDDVQVEARIDFQQFAGEVGLAHHVQAEGDFGLFAVTSEGSASLLISENGSLKVLDSSAINRSSGVTRLAVSAVGRHLKGLVEGKTVVHGHAQTGNPGRCGLFLEGRGVVRVISMKISPLKSDP